MSRRTALVAAGVLGVVGLTFGAGSAAASGRQVLPGTKPAWTTAAPQPLSVAPETMVHAKVWLATRNAAVLDALARAVSDPASAQYGQKISADQYRARFAPDAAQVAAVSRWLTDSGLQVDSVGPDNHFLAVFGTAAAAGKAFGAQLGSYAVNGKQVRAPLANLSVPASLAGSVLAVTGLSTFGHTVRPADFGAPAAFVNGTPCSQFYGQHLAFDHPRFNGRVLPYSVCGYTPSQLRGAYGVSQSRTSGVGQTVAITDAYDAPTLLSDANQYATRHGDLPFAPSQFADKSVPEDPTTGGECGGNGWYGEQALDVEAVHGMAQNANVLYYGAASCTDADLLASLARVTSDDKASLVTNSWGEPTFVVVNGQLFITIDQGTVDAYEAIFKQGAVEGIGFYFSSGDNGDELAAFGYAHPDWPTEDPWVTSVGGTSLAVGPENVRLFETGWGTDKYNLSADGTSWLPIADDPFLYGAGGGFSQIFDRPWYQKGTVPSNTPGRAVPDVAMDGDPTTGMLVGETQDFPLPSRYGPVGVHYGEYRIGGTSLSSPLFAGAQADAQQAAGAQFGFANPLIYARAHGLFGFGAFYDVLPAPFAPGNVRADYANGINADNGFKFSVRTFNNDSSLTTSRGWDDVTGVGTVTARYIRGFGAR